MKAKLLRKLRKNWLFQYDAHSKEYTAMYRRKDASTGLVIKRKILIHLIEDVLETYDDWGSFARDMFKNRRARNLRRSEQKWYAEFMANRGLPGVQPL